jgi:hypothetical protein
MGTRLISWSRNLLLHSTGTGKFLRHLQARAVRIAGPGSTGRVAGLLVGDIVTGMLVKTTGKLDFSVIHAASLAGKDVQLVVTRIAEPYHNDWCVVKYNRLS